MNKSKHKLREFKKWKLRRDGHPVEKLLMTYHTRRHINAMVCAYFNFCRCLV